MGCNDPDLQVVATCLAPVSAVAVLPDSRTALVAERTTGRVLRVQRGTDPVLVTTVPVDPSGGGGLTGLVLSPGYAEDRLVYAYATTAADNRVLRLAPGEEPKPVLTGIPRGGRDNGGALATDGRNALLVATGSAGLPSDDGSLAGKLLRIDTLGRPAADNPNPASPIVSSGLRAPGGVCTNAGAIWITDRPAPRTCSTGRNRARSGIRPGPGRTGPASRDAWHSPGCCWWRRRARARCSCCGPTTTARSPARPESLLQNRYGRLSAAATAPDGLLWLGTMNKGSGGKIVPSDDRVIRIQPPAGGGERGSRARPRGRDRARA